MMLMLETSPVKTSVISIELCYRRINTEIFSSDVKEHAPSMFKRCPKPRVCCFCRSVTQQDSVKQELSEKNLVHKIHYPYKKPWAQMHRKYFSYREEEIESRCIKTKDQRWRLEVVPTDFLTQLLRLATRG